MDYVRVVGSDNGDGSDRWFFTYNHDAEHPHFATRPGFVRIKMKFQGMVGIMGNGGKTRLTWFVNMDFGGLVPSLFTQEFLLKTLSFPISVVQETKDDLLEEDADNIHGGKGANLATTNLSASELFELELPDLKAKLAETKAEMERKNEEWRRKDEEYQNELVRKDKEHQNELTSKDEEHQNELASKDKELRRKDGELEKKDDELEKKDDELKKKDDELEKKDNELMELRKRLPRVFEE
tara:strand:- start:126 stop:842 length:717 start_codon:yes stop_codon:yes gene_type:complete